MNNPNNLFNMMQTGGLTSSAGGTRLARAIKRQSDIKRLEKQQKREARRQKRGGFFGSIAGLAGGLLGAAIPGLGLALGAGLGTGLGRLLGEKIGAGKSRSYDRSGTVFGQQAFRDVSQASRDYTRGMGERAITSGLKAALTGGLSKDGGIYGSKFNPFMKGSKFRQGLLSFSRPQLTTPTPLNVINEVAQPSLPTPNFMGKTIGKTKDFLGQLQNLGLARMYGIGGKSFAEDVTRQGMLDNAGLLMGQDIDEFAFLDDVQEQPNMQAPLLEPSFSSPSISQVPVTGGSSLIGYNQPILENFKDGGFLKLRRGAYVPGNEGFGGSSDSNSGTGGSAGQAPLLPSVGSYSPFSVALGAGFELTPEQASLISDFDPSSIESAKSQYQQNLLGMTGGMGLSSIGQGFGARARAGQEALSSAGEAIADVTSEAEAQYESSVLGQMADLISGGAEFEVADSVPQQPPSNPGTLPGQQQEGSDGRNYIWTGVSWMAT
tara:strand:+ start:2427 stop:3899 length:1473 start_codon:yes stop_codon:yes gene_type:complete